MLLRVLRTSDEIIKEGSEAWITGKIIFRNKWHSKITFFKPFRYVDEMITSENEKPIFSHWKHEHIFEGDEMQTKVIDNIQFELPLGVIGRIFRQYAKAKLHNLFNYRAAATKRLLEQERYV
jgi:ligand-binding SRPBCC domain-containing protein